MDILTDKKTEIKLKSLRATMLGNMRELNILFKTIWNKPGDYLNEHGIQLLDMHYKNIKRASKESMKLIEKSENI